jgi:hypothetical protein
MKIAVIALFISVCSFAQNSPICGRAISNEEMAVLSQEMVKRYEYKDNDLDILADVTTEVMGLYDDNYVFEVFFFMKDRKRIGINVIGSFNDEIKEKISCYLLATKIKGLPDKRFLLFYDEQSEALVYKVTNEK